MIMIDEAIKNNQKTLSEAERSSYTLTKEDSIIFRIDALKDIRIKEIINSKVRNSFILAEFQKFNIIVHKIRLDEGFSLDQISVNKDIMLDIATGVSYRVASFKNFGIHIKSGAVNSINKLYLDVACDSIYKKVINDSVLYYRFKCRKIALRYSADGEKDIFLENESYRSDTLNVIIWKRNNLLYLYFILPDQKKEYFDEENVESLINL